MDLIVLAAKLLISASIISCGGWVWETVYCSIVSGQLERRGMLFGPTCPIYGISAVVVWLALGRIQDPILLFFAGMVLATVLEYATGAVLEARFQRRWWDYSMFPGNFRGLVCPQASAVFGLFALIDVKLLQPAILGGLSALDPVLVVTAAGAVASLYAADLVLTVARLDNTTPRLYLAAQAGRVQKLFSR